MPNQEMNTLVLIKRVDHYRDSTKIAKICLWKKTKKPCILRNYWIGEQEGKRFLKRRRYLLHVGGW
ncbi:MAG: hypothetical protein ACXAD7_14695 [Candidatus Kariarchaeaceae archaeon]